MAAENLPFFVIPSMSSINIGQQMVDNTPDLKPRSLNSSLRSLHQSSVDNSVTMSHGDTIKKIKFKKHTTASQQMYPIRERNTFKNKNGSKINVRHFKELNKYNNRTLRDLCNNNSVHSPKKENVSQQKKDFNISENTSDSSKKYQDCGVNVLDSDSSKLNTGMLHDGKEVQTDGYLSDMSSSQELFLANANSHIERYVIRERTHKKILYFENLQNEILNWTMNIPLYYSANFTPKSLKEHIIIKLADKIDVLTPEIRTNDYEAKVKKEIHECLNILPMWLPHSKQDQTLFKNSLCNRFYRKLVVINNIYLNSLTKSESSLINIETFIRTSKDDVRKANFEEEYLNEVSRWLDNVKFTRPILKSHVINLIMNKVSGTLSASTHASGSKLLLKSDIMNVLETLPINITNNKNKDRFLNRCALYLAHKLFQKKKDKVKKNTSCQDASNIIEIPVYDTKETSLSVTLKQIVSDIVMKALDNYEFDNKTQINRELCDLLLDSIALFVSGIEMDINQEIYRVLLQTNHFNAEMAREITDNIKLNINNIKLALNENQDIVDATYYTPTHFSGTISVYRSDPITSTPMKKTKKYISNLNEQERTYMSNVGDYVRHWMNSLPKKFDDDINFKETMIQDLSGDIMDEMKREQLSPEVNTEKDKHLNYIVHRWLYKFDVFPDLNEAKPCIDNFLMKLKEIPAPILTAPQHGTRQAMHNLQHYEKENGWDEECIPRGIDVLEDQISVWMNEQPSQIYDEKMKKNRSKMLKKLALSLQDRLRNKSSEDEIDNDIKQWLNKVVKKEEKEHIGLLSQNLKEKIINVPQDRTLEARNEKRKKERAEYGTSSSSKNIEPNSLHNNKDSDHTMKEFIIKYIDHNYDISDPMARAAFGHLFVRELKKINKPYDRNEACDNFRKSTQEKLNSELEYIKMISDWLKNIPVDPNYNTHGNRSRVDFVIDLAKNIQEVDDERKQNPTGMDHDLMITSIITQSIRTYSVPILPAHKDNIPIMVNQLVSKIIANRSILSENDSISEIKDLNLYEFLDEYIRINGREIADDEVKLEAWTARVLQEVKGMLGEEKDPEMLDKAELCEKLSRIPMPEQDILRRFSYQFAYLREISEWMKNLPLSSVTDTSESQVERVNMMSELAQKILERENKKTSDPNDNTAEKELIEFTTNWISKLPLNPNTEIVIPILIQQLMNRIENINKKPETQVPEEPDNGKYTNIETENVSVSDEDPAPHIVEFIDNWCNNLPGESKNQDTQKIKTDIATHLFQKICELNADPRVNDDKVFRELLEDEVKTQLQTLTNCESSCNLEKQTTEFLNTVLDMKSLLKRKSMGVHYKDELETSINAAIPMPIQIEQTVDPEFELYKNHLTNMFILDNFDHSDAQVKAKYEKQIKSDMDRYFESVQRRNALPLTKNEMHNELYSELYKVPMPPNDSIADEVEQIKTKCEIEAWFEKLPLKSTNCMYENLEWDQILSAFAKRIHDIEKNESNPDEKIDNEIRKWLERLPIDDSFEQRNNINLTNNLQDILQSTKDIRKCNVTKANVNINDTSIFEHNGNESKCLRCTRTNNYKEITRTPLKRYGDILVEIVEEWCNQLPLIGDEIQNKRIKDDMSMELIKKISELNSDSDVFDDDIIYDQLLDDIIENNLVNVISDFDFQKSKPARKHQLKEMIKSIKFLAKEEKDFYRYKTELNTKLTNLLRSNNMNKDGDLDTKYLSDCFIEFFYYIDDDGRRQIHKQQIYDTLIKHNTINDGTQADPLVKINQIICEITKIPLPNDYVMKQMVEEIEMKKQVHNFLTEISNNNENTDQVEKTLAKRLNDLEKSGHSELIDQKMNSDISKVLNKTHNNVTPNDIERFVSNLKNTEQERNNDLYKNNQINENERSRYISDLISNSVQFNDSLPRTQSFPYSLCSQSSNIPQPAVPQSILQLAPLSRNELSGLYTPQQRADRSSPANQSQRYFEPFVSTCGEPVEDRAWSPLSFEQFKPDVNNNMSCKAGTCGSPLITANQQPITDSANNNLFNPRKLLNSSMTSQEYIKPDPILKAPCSSSNVSQCTGNDKRAYGPTNFRSTATPRSVLGEANSVVNPDICSSNKSRVESVQSSRKDPSVTSRDTKISSEWSRFNYMIRPIRRRPKQSGHNRSSETERYLCMCDERNMSDYGYYCMVPVDEYCTICGGFTPVWCRMPFF